MLKRFFQDLEAVFAAHNIIDLDERIGDVKHYAEPQEEEVFDAVVLPAGATWDDFKRKALEMYPGAEDDFRYSHEDLAAVATAFRVAGRVSKESIGMYYRDYSKIAHFLISKQRAHEPEVRRQFLEGFPEAAKSDITLTLRAKFPDRDRLGGYDLREILSAALQFVAAGGAATVEGTAPTAAVPMKKEDPEVVRLLLQNQKEQNDRLFALMAEVQNSLRGAPTAAARPRDWATRIAAEPPARPMRSDGCTFCSDLGHYIRDCPVASDYIARGILIKDASNFNRLALATGGPFPMSFQGRDMKEKLEAYLRGLVPRAPGARDPPPHLAEANIYQCDAAQVTSDSPEDTLNLIEALVQHAHTSGKALRFDGVEIKTGPPKNAKKLTAELAKPNTTTAKQVSKPAARMVVPPEVPQAPHPAGAGFRYTTPIEDPQAVVRAAELIKQASITMSAADLLSISPAVRKEIKELITARRVATNLHEDADDIDMRFDPEIMFHEEAMPKVGHLILTLRQLMPLVGGRITPECVLDPGSMIVAMRKDVWISLGAALDTETTTTMQSANRGLNSTMGVIPDVSFEIGDVVLHTPVHVVEDAPYEVLLGRPFFALGSITTQDYRNGDQFLTIRDPATGVKITVPSLERRSRRRGVDTEMVTVGGDTRGEGGSYAAASTNRSILYIPEVANKNASSAYVPCVSCERCPCRKREQERARLDRGDVAAADEPGAPVVVEAFALEAVDPTRRTLTSKADLDDAFGGRAIQVDALERVLDRLQGGANPAGASGLEDGDYLVYEDDSGTACVEVFAVKRYKKVANKVIPVSATLPEEFRIERREPAGILQDMAELPTRPPDFIPGKRYTAERRGETPVDPQDFLQPEERKLAEWVILANEDALAWTEEERGAFHRAYFDPIMIPTIPHTPWVLKNIPIPKGIHDKVCEAVKTKIATGVYEPSNSSYRSRWFCVVKKDKVSLRLVHDLQPLNKVTIRDVATLPYIEDIIERSAGRACYGGLDLLVAFDHRELDVRSRDLTTFQTPFGAFRLSVMPMGYTNSVPILQGDVSFIFRDEIPEHMNPFADDCNVLGPTSRYELPAGGYETIPENSGIRRFVWEHFTVMHRCLHRMKRFGGTFSGKKLYPCVPRLELLGQTVHYEGRSPDMSKIQRIIDWPTPESVTEVRGFLGTCGLVRVFVEKFSHLARPLVKLTRKDALFDWGAEESDAMAQIKAAVLKVPDLTPIDYQCGREIVLAVDSSKIAVGFILLQEQERGPRRPSRFGSIAWNEVESRYSQPKLEIYGVWRALRACRAHVAGVEFVVEVDAKFIKDMINNPDTVPSATINRWIAGILLFTFSMRHIPAKDHQPCDGLSRRRPAPGEQDDSREAEEFIDTSYCLWLEFNNVSMVRVEGTGNEAVGTPRRRGRVELLSLGAVDEETSSTEGRSTGIPRSAKAVKADEQALEILRILEGGGAKDSLNDQDRRRMAARVGKFFAAEGRLWRRDPTGRHRLYIPEGRRHDLLQEAHDDLGHRGKYVVRTRLAERFWWPAMDQDIDWFIRTCDTCQKRQFMRSMAPPRLIEPAVLFLRWHVDTMKCPTYAGYTNLIHARESLGAIPEGRPLRRETGKTVAAFIHEQLLCRYGAIAEIITDNGPAMVAAAEELAKTYGIRHIKISAYNSRANGVVERRHRDLRETLAKVCGPSMQGWTNALPAAMWAERCTVLKSVGKSPFEIATGQTPRFPFDLREANWLGDAYDSLDTTELLAARARQLQKRPEDLAAVHEKVTAARARTIKQLEQTYRHRIKDYNFQRGDLVLVRNTRIEMELDRKAKEKWMGPYVVFNRGRNGSYRISEVDGAVHSAPYAASRLVPYFARTAVTRPVHFELPSGDGEPDDNGTDSEEEYDTAEEDAHGQAA